MVDISMKELLEAGVHFGHQTRRWNPKMKKYIFGSRNGIYIIDLQKTMKLFRETAAFITDSAAKGKTVMFVGTKRQAQEAIESVGQSGIPFVNQRWLGGTLTNFNTIKKSIDKLNDLEALLESEEIENYSKKERYGLERKRNKLLKLFRGLKELNRIPDILFVIDPKREKIAVQEARIMNVPVVAVVDTNCDPDVIDWVIPGNDDAIRAIKLFVSKMVQAIQEGRDMAGINQEIAEEAPNAKEAANPEAASETEAVKAEAKPEPKTEKKAEEKPKAKTATQKTTASKTEKKTEKIEETEKPEKKVKKETKPKTKKVDDAEKTVKKTKPAAKKTAKKKTADKTEKETEPKTKKKADADKEEK